MASFRKAFRAAGVVITAFFFIYFGVGMSRASAEQATPDGIAARELASWQPWVFIEIVELLTPPDTQQGNQRPSRNRNRYMNWFSGDRYNPSLELGVAMTNDPGAIARERYFDVAPDADVFLEDSSDPTRPGISFHRFSGTVTGRKDLPVQVLVAASPLPNGMYLSFYAGGKKYSSREKDVATFFDNIRINMPRGENSPQTHEWEGFSFKTPWVWTATKLPTGISYDGFECGTGRKMDVLIIHDNISFEEGLSVTKRIFDVTCIGDEIINGIPVKRYELIRKLEGPFWAEMVASVQAPMVNGQFVKISGRVFGKEAWGQARESLGTILESVVAGPGVLHLNQEQIDAQASADTPEAHPSVQIVPESGTPTSIQPQIPDTQIPAKEDPTGSGSFCRLKSLRSFYDKAGRGERVTADGSPDTLLEVVLNMPGHTIEALALKSTQGQQAEWDTIPGSGNWVMIVIEKNKTLNRSDGSVRIDLGADSRKFGLLVQDNNALAAGKGAFILQIFFDGHEPVEISVER